VTITPEELLEAVRKHDPAAHYEDHPDYPFPVIVTRLGLYSTAVGVDPTGMAVYEVIPDPEEA